MRQPPSRPHVPRAAQAWLQGGGWVGCSASSSRRRTIYGAYMREACITGRTEAEIARLQRWRREHNVMWVSEMFRADGTTLRDRFTTNLASRARRCEPDAIRLCNITFGRRRGPGNQSNRPRMGLPTPPRRGTLPASAATCGTTARLAASAQKGTLVRRLLCSPLMSRHGESQPERT